MKSERKNLKMRGQSLWIMNITIIILLLTSPIGRSHAQSTDAIQMPLLYQPGPQEMLEQYWINSFGTPFHLPSQIEPFATMKRELLAKAEPDECFKCIGESYMYDKSCPSDCIPKVNQAYVWGLAKSGDNLWFGTAPNVHCLVIGSFFGLDDPPPHQTSSWVCEFSESLLCNPNLPAPLPDSIGDWRPPQIFVYNTTSGELEEKTPNDPRILRNLGIRSAGALGDVVMLGGPSLNQAGGVDLFAFNTETGDYLGSKSLSDYNNIRKWIVVNGVLYTAVGNKGGGSVLKWTGQLTYSPDTGKPDLDQLFKFEIVGTLDGSGAELAYHENRLFVATWPGPGQAGIWMSPLLTECDLNDEDKGNWSKVWEAGDYEPDLITAYTYGGGALASFDGYLYWGTMHVPGLSTVKHFNRYGMPDDINEIKAAVLGTYRALSIFRGRDFGTEEQEIELLYGMPKLPKYIPDLLDPNAEDAVYDVIPTTGRWELVDNNMGLYPLWGLSGFGNFYNNYTWTMEVYEGQLFVGTMDWSYLAGESILDRILGPAWTSIKTFLPIHSFGADLYRFYSSSAPAVPESLSGVGNYTSYGIRTMISDDALYLGMSNPMNLLTDTDDCLPEGGWELIKLTPKRCLMYAVADQAKIIVEQSSREGAVVCLDASESYVEGDCCDCLDFEYEWIIESDQSISGVNPCLVFPLGKTHITLKVTAKDCLGHEITGETQLIVIVKDKTAPIIRCLSDIVAEQDVEGGKELNPNPPSVFDICDPNPVVTSVPSLPHTFGLGTSTITWTATDESGNIATCTQMVTIIDKEPPIINKVTASPDCFWPTPCWPLYKEVTVSVEAEDLCDSNLKCKIIDITSDGGDCWLPWKYKMSPDFIITGDLTVLLKATINLHPLGKRVYTITVECTDSSGNSTIESTTVEVGCRTRGEDLTNGIRGTGQSYLRSMRQPYYESNRTRQFYSRK